MQSTGRALSVSIEPHPSAKKERVDSSGDRRSQNLSSESTGDQVDR